MLFDLKHPVKSFAKKMGLQCKFINTWEMHDKSIDSTYVICNNRANSCFEYYFLIATSDTNCECADSIQFHIGLENDEYHVYSITPYRRRSDSYYITPIRYEYDISNILNMQICESIKTFCIYNIDKIKQA